MQFSLCITKNIKCQKRNHNFEFLIHKKKKN